MSVECGVAAHAVCPEGAGSVPLLSVSAGGGYLFGNGTEERGRRIG